MFSNTFKALSDPVRMDILDMLRKNGSLNAGDIAKEFNLTNATISYHLKILKNADLAWFIKFRGEGNEK